MDATHLPRWRGFNLLEKFTDHHNAAFREWDFDFMARWGFDFARLPMSYWCWAEPDPERWLELREESLVHVDQAVELGRQYGIHVNLNLHRGPGYCVNPPAEPLSLWTDERALEACCFHWAHLAQRYRGLPNEQVTFDLLNEPPDIDEATYVRVVTALVEAIRDEDPDRLIIADGLCWGNKPVHGLVDLGIGQSTRGYAPMQISHYKAGWVGGSDSWDPPTWPLDLGGGDVWDRERLRAERLVPWKALEAKGVGVHAGEWGAFIHTPHEAVMAWMKDSLELWEEAGWGWAMWNLRGAFGPLDSGRPDVVYEELEGHQVDRAMLDLILEH